MKAHDVRRMHSCQLCQQVGIHQPNGLPIPGLIRTYESPQPKRIPHQYAHPRCYIQRHGFDAFLRFSTEQLGDVRMGDVTNGHLVKIVAELRNRASAAAHAAAAVATSKADPPVRAGER